mmetsp:Transcript_12977/g.39273  ORF Transcript_12977/g.39273 Transcript_12977/m.39273 type:complete len:110 (-) Transcript_12977:2321-2650(-)
MSTAVVRGGPAQTPTNTLYLADLDQRVDQRLLHELCLQAGPVVRISLPKEEGFGHKGFAFCEYPSVETAQYAQALFAGTVRLYGRTIRVAFSPKGSTEQVQSLKDPLPE